MRNVVNKAFTLVIPIKSDDFEYAKKCIPLIKKNLNPDKIVIISSVEIKIECEKFPNIEFLDENTVYPGLTFDSVKQFLKQNNINEESAGWYLQQFLKLSYAYICNTEYYLVWDADMLPLNKLQMFDEKFGKPYLTLKKEYVPEYFLTMKRLLDLDKQIEESFIAEHMMFSKQIVLDMIEKINKYITVCDYFWQKIIIATLPESINHSNAFSEFETYGSFVKKYYPDSYKYRRLRTLRHAKYFLGENPNEKTLVWASKSFDTISFEHFDKPLPFKYLFLNPIFQTFFSFHDLIKIIYPFIRNKYKKRLNEFDFAFGEKSLFAQIDKNGLRPRRNVTHKKQLLIDVGTIAFNDFRTGTERVVRGLGGALLKKNIENFEVRLVYPSIEKKCYMYAHNYTLKTFGIDDGLDQDSPIEYNKGDIFFGVALEVGNTLKMVRYLRKMNSLGVYVGFFLHDIIPVHYPYTPPLQFSKEYIKYLKLIFNFDFLLCNSKNVENELLEYLVKEYPDKLQSLTTSWIHLGCNIEDSAPSCGFPDNYKQILEKLSYKKTFLVVSTLYKRKMQSQILNAFEILWKKGYDINLVFVGKYGNDVDVLVSRIRNHIEYNKHLYWLEGISDEYLEKVYEVSDCVIMASIAEGFGLSIIEGASKGKKLILRDIPVFREVAGEHALYFSGYRDEDLSEAVEKWLELEKTNSAPSPDGIELLTWDECADKFLYLLNNKFLNNKLYAKFSDFRNFGSCNDYRNSKVGYKNFERLFSVKNEYSNGVKRKVITILGIRIKF